MYWMTEPNSFMNVLSLIQHGHINYPSPKTNKENFTPIALFFNSANRWLPDAVGGFIDFPVERLFWIVKIYWICYFEIGLFLTLI